MDLMILMLVQVDNGSDHNATATLKVYVMPSYLTEGMVVLAINAALISFFVVCGLKSYIARRREKPPPKDDKKEAGAVEVLHYSKRETTF